MPYIAKPGNPQSQRINPVNVKKVITVMQCEKKA